MRSLMQALNSVKFLIGSQKVGHFETIPSENYLIDSKRLLRETSVKLLQSDTSKIIFGGFHSFHSFISLN